MMCRPAWVWLMVAALALSATAVYLYFSDLLWTVGSPTAVAVVALCLAASPTIGFVVGRRGRSWWVVPLAYLVAVIVATSVIRSYVPSGEQIREDLVATGVPAFAGAGPVDSDFPCRMICIDESPGGFAEVTIKTNDVEAACREVVAHLVAEGWSFRSSSSETCTSARLERPAPVEHVYVIIVLTNLNAGGVSVSMRAWPRSSPAVRPPEDRP
jgi:hypothetical protein